MRRLILVLSVALVMVAMLALEAGTAFAVVPIVDKGDAGTIAGGGCIPRPY